MDEKTFLSLFIVLMFAALAGLVYWAGPSLAGWSRRRAQFTSGGFVLLGISASVFAYLVTAEMDRVTLFEAKVKGNPETQVGDPVVIRQLQFNVEHPDVTHTLMLHPRREFAEMANYTVKLNVRLWAEPSALYLDTPAVFEPEQRSSNNSSGTRHTYYEWDAIRYEFTPTQSGSHSLELGLLTINTPDVFVRIEDPQKTDGKRDPSLRD